MFNFLTKDIEMFKTIVIQHKYNMNLEYYRPDQISGIFQLKCSKAYLYKLYKFILCNKNGNLKSKIVLSWLINCSVCWWCHWWTCFPSRSLQILPSRCPHPRPRQLMLCEKDEFLFIFIGLGVYWEKETGEVDFDIDAYVEVNVYQDSGPRNWCRIYTIARNWIHHTQVYTFIKTQIHNQIHKCTTTWHPWCTHIEGLRLPRDRRVWTGRPLCPWYTTQTLNKSRNMRIIT